MIVVIAGLTAGGLTAYSSFQSSCSLDSIQVTNDLGQNSFIYDAKGTFMGTIAAENNRSVVPLDLISPYVAKATVAIEDRRFYQHGGIDFEGIARAAFSNLKAGEITQGGSTITQQLVRNLYISNERSYQRKLKEACLAMKLDDAWSKDEILEGYMNQVYYGHRAYGVEAAAQTYFNKSAADLNLTEAALIAGLPQAPSLYDPFVRPKAAATRRNEVLRAMRDAGDISQTEYDRARSKPVNLILSEGKIYTEVAEPLFFNYVRDQLIREYGAATVRNGGLKVYTTILPGYQEKARQAIRDTLNLEGDPAAALVTINPATGAILAMVQAQTGVLQKQFNVATQGQRQAGSSFKTFVLAEAIRRGIDPQSTTYLSAPFRYQPDPASEPWTPATFDNTYAGPIDLVRATLRSDNAVYARLTLDLGPSSVAKLARQMGVNQSKLLPVASIGLGSNAVTPLEMASAYATLAAGGVYRKPIAVKKVVFPDGTVKNFAEASSPSACSGTASRPR
ncbi:MAG: transglycosylase domain-containing protein [Thermoleophilia bacterium]